MEKDTLISLPPLQTAEQRAVEMLVEGLNGTIVGPPGCGTTSIALNVQAKLSANGVASTYFDCKSADVFAERLSALKAPVAPLRGKNGPRKAVAALVYKIGGMIEGEDSGDQEKHRSKNQTVIIIDHASCLTTESFKSLLNRLKRITAGGKVRELWVGNLDAHKIRKDCDYHLHSDNRTHVCLTELDRDDLLRIYRTIAKRKERVWGEAMLYFALDWCGNDVALADQMVDHFYGNWTEPIYDDSVAECLTGWLEKSAAIRGYRERFAALPDDCKEKLRILCGGGKLVSHRPEVHLETCEKMRRLFLDGFLCANLLPGYYQFRSLTARFIVEDQLGMKAKPIEFLRRAANARVNLLLQDVEVSLRGMLKTMFRKMSADEVKTLLKKTKIQRRLMDEDFRPKLMEWAGQQIPASQQTQPGQQTPAGQSNLRASLGKFLGEESTKFEAANNLWSEVCDVFHEAYGSENINDEPTPEQIVACLTFSQLSNLLQSLTDKLFLATGRSKKLGEPPKKRWPTYLARVGRLRNDAAHLRNIRFQDIEDLLKTLDDIRQDQLEFAIIPD